MDLQTILNEIKETELKLQWEGSFSQYFEMAVRRPEVVRLSHARIYDTILDAGVETDPWGIQKYRLFSGDLFGLEDVVEQVVDYFGSAARRLDTRKRLLLLVGPPGSGKSTLANLIKKGIEHYTRTEPGALYAIKGCPMQEEPMHLIPPEHRPELEEKYGLHIEGDLCPHCRWMLHETYHGDISAVQVRRVLLNEQTGTGIGTWIAADPGSQDISRLIGSIDRSRMGGDRLETFGKAFYLNGELNVANRGLMEFIEIFKLDERFLSMLLVLTEEQKIKAPGYGMIYADEAILAHSNMEEYNAVVNNRKTEALQDRMVVVRVPYNLRVDEEIRIYRKLLQEVDLKGVHLSPLSLEVASTFAVLSRLQPSLRFRINPIQKMHLYNQQYVEGYSQQDLLSMREENPAEGMTGISPRFVINQISRAVLQLRATCLDPLDLLQFLRDGVEQSTTLVQERAHLADLYDKTRLEFIQVAQREVQKAFVERFDGAASAIVTSYIDGLRSRLENTGSLGERPGTTSEADGKTLRDFERAIGVMDYDIQKFRQDIFRKVKPLLDQGLPVDYRVDARLEEAAIRRLCPSLREVHQVLEAKQEGDPAWARREEITHRLIRERGYEPECAQRLLEHVAASLAENNKEINLPKALHWLTG